MYFFYFLDVDLTAGFVIFLEHGMSYLSRWRKIHSEAAAIALECSSSEDGCRGNLNPNQCNVEDEGEDLAEEGSSCLNEADEIGDADSDFGYREYVSTDSEEVIESAKEDEVTLQEKLASWATRSKCGRSQIDELLGILKDEGLELPPFPASSNVLPGRRVMVEEDGKVAI